MATPENAETGKDATPSNSKSSMLRPNAPQIRTALALTEKHEQILDGLERQSITAKVAEQMGQQLKGIIGIAKLEMQFWNTVAKFGRKAPVPRSPLMRSALGLSENVSPTDGETIRRLIGEA